MGMFLFGLIYSIMEKIHHYIFVLFWLRGTSASVYFPNSLCWKYIFFLSHFVAFFIQKIFGGNFVPGKCRSGQFCRSGLLLLAQFFFVMVNWLIYVFSSRMICCSPYRFIENIIYGWYLPSSIIWTLDEDCCGLILDQTALSFIIYCQTFLQK